jgi:hypothetical protein
MNLLAFSIYWTIIISFLIYLNVRQAKRFKKELEEEEIQ